MSQTGISTESVDKVKDDLYEPGMFHVVFINDNYTPMDFVTEVLMKIFGKTEAEAVRIMMKVHNDGQGIAGTYIEDVALTKSEITNKVAKENGFPLKTKVQPV